MWRNRQADALHMLYYRAREEPAEMSRELNTAAVLGGLLNLAGFNTAAAL